MSNHIRPSNSKVGQREERVSLEVVTGYKSAKKGVLLAYGTSEEPLTLLELCSSVK